MVIASAGDQIIRSPSAGDQITRSPSAGDQIIRSPSSLFLQNKVAFFSPGRERSVADDVTFLFTRSDAEKQC